jgi:hypothetical protein
VILEKPLSITVHAQTIVTHAMKQNHGISVWISRSHVPCAQYRTVRGSYLYTAKLGSFRFCRRFNLPFRAGWDLPARRAKSDPAQDNSAQERSEKVQGGEEKE